MKIQKSAEDYLEMILMLSEKKGYARSIDVANEMGVTKPSVSVAVKRLRENGYLSMDGDGLLTLTESGDEIARRMYDRHKMLTEFFVSIGVSEETAREDACKIEHDLSDESYRAMCRHIDWRGKQNN
ncbi:MAG: metal-dependent transcriptional regulator [Oscillospiraceae bacterium]|nr:metal-dependent transcriptional regulator [Oscillospiraceae bacterium]